MFLSLSEYPDGSYEFNSRRLVNVWGIEWVGIIMLMFKGQQSPSLCKQCFLTPLPSWHLNIPNELQRISRSECTAEGIFPFFLCPASWQVKWVCSSWVDYFVVVWSSSVTLSPVFWFIFWTSAIVTDITQRLSNSNHIYYILEVNC